MSGYRSVVEFAESQNRYYKIGSDNHLKGRGEGDWLNVLHACVQANEETPHDYFAGAWVHDRTENWFPGLATLERAGILEKRHTTRAGKRAYWKLRDPKGIKKALTELGVRD